MSHVLTLTCRRQFGRAAACHSLPSIHADAADSIDEALNVRGEVQLPSGLGGVPQARIEKWTGYQANGLRVATRGENLLTLRSIKPLVR